MAGRSDVPVLLPAGGPLGYSGCGQFGFGGSPATGVVSAAGASAPSGGPSGYSGCGQDVDGDSPADGAGVSSVAGAGSSAGAARRQAWFPPQARAPRQEASRRKGQAPRRPVPAPLQAVECRPTVPAPRLWVRAPPQVRAPRQGLLGRRRLGRWGRLLGGRCRLLCGCGLLGRRRVGRWRRLLSRRRRLFRRRGLFGWGGLLLPGRGGLPCGRGLFGGGSGFLLACWFRLFFAGGSGFRQRRRIVVLAAQEGDDVRALLGIRVSPGRPSWFPAQKLADCGSARRPARRSSRRYAPSSRACS